MAISRKSLDGVRADVVDREIADLTRKVRRLEQVQDALLETFEEVHNELEAVRCLLDNTRFTIPEVQHGEV